MLKRQELHRATRWPVLHHFGRKQAISVTRLPSSPCYSPAQRMGVRVGGEMRLAANIGAAVLTMVASAAPASEGLTAAQNWSGPWVGAAISSAETGYRHAPLFIGVNSGSVASHDRAGAIVGSAGWNFRLGPMVFGPTVTVTHFIGAMKGMGGGNSSRTSWSAGARIGYLATENLLIYGTGGISVRGHSTSVVYAIANDMLEFPVKNGSRIGGYVGGGAEYAVSQNWSVLLEYRYMDHGTIRWNGPAEFRTPYGPLVIRSSHTQFHAPFSHMVQLGVAYRW